MKDLRKTKRELVDELQKLRRRLKRLEGIKKKLATAEEELEASRKSLARAEEVAGLGTWAWDMLKDKITWSEDLYRLYDIDPARSPLSYDALMERVHPEDRDYHDNLAEGWIEDKRGGSFEYRILRPDGTVRWILGEGEVEFDSSGTPVRMFGVLQDITGRKEAEEEVRKTKVFYERLVGEAGDAIIAVDRQGKVVTWNPGAERLLGWTAQEVLGRSYADLHGGEVAEQIRDFLDRVFKGYTLSNLEVKRRRKNGVLADMLATISPVRDHRGEVEAAIGVLKEITDLKRAEEELRRAHHQLQEAYDKLAQAQAGAIVSEKLAALGRLTAGVSHEILNPLNVITMNLQMMIAEPGLEIEVKSQCADMLTQAERIVRIARDLLYFSRQRLPERRPLDFNQEVKRTLGLLEHDLRLKNIDVELNLDNELKPVLADPDQIQQVLLNLISNARDAMAGGGRIALTTKGHDHSVLFRVEDTGPGVEAEHMDKIFDPFFTTKSEGEGTGLGLAICQGIVDAHGGAILVENIPSGGAAFIVRLGA